MFWSAFQRGGSSWAAFRRGAPAAAEVPGRHDPEPGTTETEAEAAPWWERSSTTEEEAEAAPWWERSGTTEGEVWAQATPWWEGTEIYKHESYQCAVCGLSEFVWESGYLCSRCYGAEFISV